MGEKKHKEFFEGYCTILQNGKGSVLGFELDYYRLKAIGLAPIVSRLKITLKSDPNNK